MAKQSAVRCTARNRKEFGNATVQRVIGKDQVQVDAGTTLTFFAGNLHFQAYHVTADYQGNRLYVAFSGAHGARWFYYDGSDWQTWRSRQCCPALKSATGVIPRPARVQATVPEHVAAAPADDGLPAGAPAEAAPAEPAPAEEAPAAASGE